MMTDKESEKDQETTEQPEAIVQDTAGGGPTDKKPRAAYTLIEFEDGTAIIANSTGYAGRKFFFREPSGKMNIDDALRVCVVITNDLNNYKAAELTSAMLRVQAKAAMEGRAGKGKIINPNSPAGQGIVH